MEKKKAEDGEVKRPRAGGPAISIETLRREAAHQLQERLREGALSTGELLKVMGMEQNKGEEPRRPRGDWRLSVGEDE